MEKNYGFFLSATGKKTSRQEEIKRAKFKKRCLFWKKLQSNWLKTLCINWNYWVIHLYLRESDWDLSLSRICVTSTKKRQIQSKIKYSEFAKKTVAQPIKHKAVHQEHKFFWLLFFRVATEPAIIVILCKENRNLAKWANMQESRFF